MIIFLISAFCTLSLMIEIFCIKEIPVLAKTFPLSNTEAVTFTLAQNIAGARDFAISLALDALKEASIIFLLTILTVAILLLATRLLRKYGVLKQGKHPNYLEIAIFLNVICLAILARGIYTDIPIAQYYKIWKDSGIIPEHSEFYTTEYIDPDSVKIRFREKRNLILIFLESIEYNFQDSLNGGNLPQNLIPEITEYLKAEQSVIPGGTQIVGTGWTMADAVAKTCGIPLMFPPRFKRNSVPQVNFLPGATCLTDLLERNGYNTVVSKGAPLNFSGMDLFLRQHSVNNGYGMREYKKIKPIDQDVLSEWGITDSAHYELVKEHIGQLSASKRPWAVWLFTVNTHTPYGLFDPACNIPRNVSNAEKIQENIRCTSRQVQDFIEWAKTQEWFEYTTIAVMGDHATMSPKDSVGFKDTTLTHYWLDFFINPAKKFPSSKREFSSLDMFPTILEAIGADIPEHSLGLGRSLYSREPTLLEKYGLDSLNKALGKRSVEYDYFLYFDKKGNPPPRKK
ncbi:LTA synthase family protein [uncultured Fibrobacter sp.]|uniref:LTA synthase family protein n=1 Tax=uncultured Fibrobacter sp. TaxID=261512 RepID=UPI002620FC5D|nr:LTA synthase family protein [uncultured Fibrobacter sp.]